MLLDYVRPVDIYDVGYYKLLLRGILVVSLELLLLYIAYNDESPTSFIYFMFGGVIFAFKMRLRANKSFDKEATSVEEREELEIKIRDNIELFKVGVTGRTCYVLFAITMTIIFGCSVFYSKLQNENDAYPFIQLKPDELKTKYLLIVLFISWAVVVMDFTCGRSYHWSELMVYEKFNIKYLQVGIEYVLVYLIFTFSQQVRFSIFSLIFFFFVLLTITVFLISLLRVDKKTVSFGRYISFLKWLTLAGMIVIYLKKSYKKFIDLFGKQQQGGTGNKGNSIKDLIDQFIDKEENFDRILIIFILSTLRQFFADVSNMIDSVRNIIHTKQNIAKESRFVSFFATHILLLMGKRGSDILNYNGNYKLEYFRELAEAPTVLEVFNSIFSKVKLKLSTGQKYYIWAKRILRTILSIAITIFKNHMVVIFQLILNYMVIFKSQNMMLMIMPIIWCMLSFVAFNPGFAVTISIIFLYIPTSLAILQVMASSILCKKNGVIYNWLRLEHYCTFMNTYPILNDTTTTQVISNESEKTRLFTMLTITIFYVILLIERKKNLQYITNTIVTNLDAIGGEVQNILYEDIATLVKFLVSKIFSNFFYICLIFLFMGIIQTISLFNFLFIIFFFYFILKAEKAKQYWIFLLLYLQFLLVTRYLYSLKFFTFNLDRETSAMIGLYFGTGNPVEETRAMTSYWFVLVAISVQYQLFYTKLALEYRRVELEFNSRILEKAKLITIEILIGLRMVYMNTILWAFHFFLVLILIYSERTIFNVILMIMEVIFFFYHLITSKDTNDLNNRRKLNKFWTVMVATILFFSFLFYIFLFCKYTMTKRLISNVLNLRDDVGDTDVLNRQIANEFTMLYLIRQKQLSIEESSFIRENLKIMLAFVSFFKIMLDREEIKKQSENNAVTDMVANEVEELKRQEEELKNALAFGRADSDEEDEEGFEMGELEDSMRNNSGELGDDNPLGMLRDVFTTTKKPVEKLKFGLNDIVQIYDRLLVYLSHIWKSVILIHITVWTQEGPNVFKLLILITVLITFYRYIRAATALMNRSRLFEVIDKKLKYYNDAFVRKFEVEEPYAGLDIDQASDHYMVSNDNFYQSFRNQLSKINTQISKLLYYLVFNCAWIYFIYVYVNQVFTFFSLTNTKAIPNKAIGARAEDFLKLLFMNTAGSAGTLVDHKREQFISFILIALLVIEKKIIEAVSKNLDLMKEDNEDQFDCEKCATNILAHLDLYISVRENAASAAKAKKGQAQGNEGPADHPSNIKVASSIDFLKRKINDSIKNSKMQELLAQEESKRTLNSNLFQRLSEGDQLDDISNKQKIRLCLHEKTSYLDKVIFFNVIKNKFSFAQVQYALMHNMQRAGIIFLMTIVTFSPTVINVLLLLIIFFLEIRNKSFSEELSTLCLVSCIFILKDDLLMMLSFSQSLKTQIDSYKFILYYNQKVVYFSTAFLLICNIFMLIAIGLTKSILIGLNTHKLPKLKIFWMFVVKKKSGILRNVRLHVDHKKWVSAGNSLLLTVRNLLYVYPLEIYLIIMIIIPLLMFERVTPYVMGFIAFPYLISFIQFKERGTKAKIERFFFKYFILLCWVTLLIFYPLTTLLPSKDVGEIFSPTLLKVEFTLPLAILINQTYKEFMATEDYEDTQLKLQKQRVLISSLINYCYTYDYNERKLRENINIFVKQRHVIECTEKISNLGENEDLNFDEKIVDNLFSYDENLLPIIFQKCTTFERLRIKFYTFMYSFMLAFNYESIFESVFYLYTTFKHKNRNVISSTTGLDLNQFLKLESDMMIENIKQAEQFYLRLKEKDIDSLKRFEEELIKIKDKISYTSKIDRSKSSQLRESIGQSEIREASDQKGKSPTEIYGLESSRVDLKPEDDASRKKIDHEKAANAIFDRLNGPKMTKTNKNDIFDFPIGAHMNSKKIDKLIFHNIQPYFIEQTNYFTKFDYMVFLKLILGILLSNMEILIIMMMTMVHIWAGGVYAIIIFTIVFFILIEERPGQYKLWLMIDSIYLLVLIIIFTITNNYNFIVVTQGENKKRNMLPSEQSAELVLLFLGKMDSQYGICIIFFLIILLRINFEKLGFYNKSIMGVETLPMAVHRIIINEDFYEVFDKEIEKKKLRVQAVEDLVLKKFKENQSSFL